MKFTNHKALDYFLNDLFDRYKENVPAVKIITDALINRGVINAQDEIVNDHVAFRTLGVPHLGIQSFEKIFLKHGYQKRDQYYFEEKKLNAYWYAPPSEEYPRVFMSELMVNELSEETQQIIRKYTDPITSDPVDNLDLDDAVQVAAFFHKPLWELPTKADYMALLAESEYAAWVIYNRYYLNHYTISVHALKEGYNTLSDFNKFVEQLDIRLNNADGIIKTSPDGLLSQSSTVAEMHEVAFADGGKMKIAGSYVEFAERAIMPEYRHLSPDEIKPVHRREGFETSNADKIFESTYTEQTQF
ncbi:DUF1338 domain-containing protein [Solitalea lacus]|uniref:DUF1338 domain-containing protein n=1 Tax=Solitalea lacus TaxID=2911172 RepID=UPI001EDA0877|nr:DUF1338 domain-containing protein [Solitalea lacus]UKJ06188.1 DUF1338 domain-containing protein [Solitalea lacus]